jgi:F-type H+-transporting ATPase subunit b
MWSILVAFADHATDAAGHAADHPTHADVLDISNWLPGVTALIVFLIAFAVLALKVWPTITKALDEREQKIRGEIEAAEQAREQAKAALAEYQQSLANVREEAGQMIAKARADAKAVADELRSRNEAELSDMKSRAQREIEVAKESALRELHAEAATLATAIAGKILQREINEHDQQRLISESIQQLATSGRN